MKRAVESASVLGTEGRGRTLRSMKIESDAPAKPLADRARQQATRRDSFVGMTHAPQCAFECVETVHV